MSAVGPGAVSTVALVAPLAAPIAKRLALPAFLVALVVANGANAGNLSPLSAVGIIANSRMAEAGLAGHEAKVFAANFLAHVAVTVGVYLFWLWRAKAGQRPPAAATADPAARTAFEGRHTLTLAVIAAWTFAVVALSAARRATWPWWPPCCSWPCAPPTRARS